jgi:hypothetical protein
MAVQVDREFIYQGVVAEAQADLMVMEGQVLVQEVQTQLAVVVAVQGEDQMHRLTEAQAMEQVVTDLQVQVVVLILEEMAVMAAVAVALSPRYKAHQVQEDLAVPIRLLHGDLALVLEAVVVEVVAEDLVDLMAVVGALQGQGLKE